MATILDSLESHLNQLHPGDATGAEVLRKRTLMIITKLFGENSDYQVDVLNVRFVPPQNLWPSMDDEKYSGLEQDSWAKGVAEFRGIIETMREDLSLKERGASEYARNAVMQKRKAAKNERDVFIIHGHDHTLRTEVENLIRKVGLNPIILDDQANRGRTVIEKFEAHAAVRFAVAILSADDLGRAKSEADLKPRARQNVLFELGYFFGVLGRQNIAALLPQTVEEPSDIKGVIWIPMDERWGHRLVKELRAAGLAADANAI